MKGSSEIEVSYHIFHSIYLDRHHCNAKSFNLTSMVARVG